MGSMNPDQPNLADHIEVNEAEVGRTGERHPHPAPQKKSKDYLWLHLRDLPYFRALLRAVEARFYQDLDLPAPTLDLGCGDGHFATIAFDQAIDVGLDPWASPLKQAARRGGYRWLVQAEGGLIPFRSSRFASAVSNSVLEHIPEVETVLSELARVLKPGAPFVFCVPNHRFLPNLSIGRGLDAMRLSPAAEAYRRFFNRISRHHHCDPPEVWEERLARSGFSLLRWWHYFSIDALRVLEWGHYLGLPSLIARMLTGRWIIAPTRGNLWVTQRLLTPYYNEDPVQANGTYTFYIAQRE
jgi:SAM-dependent methyltransferase